MRDLHYLILFFFFVIVSTSFSQNRAILHFGADGQQEIVPLKDNRKIQDVLNQLHEQKKAEQMKYQSDLLQWQDTIRYYREDDMRLMFRFDPMDVAFQWYVIEVDLEILELWWRREDDYEGSKSAQIRVWDVDKRIFDLPNTAVNASGHLGYYEMNCDSCDYSTTPYKDESEGILQTMSDSDTTRMYFDPLRTERVFHRTDVSIDSNGWQKVSFENNDLSDLYYREREPFGFTIQNTTPKAQRDSSFMILSMILTQYDSTEFFNPYRTMKFYTSPFGEDSTVGWKIRNYELGTYLVVSYHWGGYFVTFNFLGSDEPLPAERENKIVVIFDDHYTYPPQHPELRVKSAFLNYKTGHARIYDKIPMIVKGDTLTATLPTLSPNKDLYTYLEIYDSSGIRFQSNVEAYGIVSSFKDKSNHPFMYQLRQNYPNPFNPVTGIGYQMSAVSNVELNVYNLIGQKVATLVSGRQAAGDYQVEWDASGFSSGIYYYQLVAGDYVETKKMVLIK